jgi:hypothetical protein
MTNDMDAFFPEMNPDLVRVPPEETRILSLAAEHAAPNPEFNTGERVRVNLKITPFLQRPHIEVILSDADGEELSMTNLIEPMAWNLEFVMHLRGRTGPSPWHVSAHLFYPEGPGEDRAECEI